MNPEPSYRFTKLIAAILIINLALVAGWFFKQQYDENQRMKSDISAIQDELKNLGPNTKQEIAEAVENARKARLNDEEEATLVNRYRGSINHIAPIKLILTEDYVNQGQFSANLFANELSDLTQYTRDPITRIEIDKQKASLTVYLKSRSNGYYRLDPVPNAQTGMITWTCDTYNDPLLKRALPECNYHEN